MRFSRRVARCGFQGAGFSSQQNLCVLCVSALSSSASYPFFRFQFSNFYVFAPLNCHTKNSITECGSFAMARLPHSNAIRTHCGEALEPAEICHVHGEYVVDSMHVHCRRQTRVVDLHSRDAVLHDSSFPLPVNGLAVRQ